MSIRVLLVDDQPLLRTGFRMILSAVPDLQVVGEAADGRAAVEMAPRLRADVVLMDIRMPVMDGVEATRRLAGPDVRDPVKVLILTTFDLDDYVIEALRAGASGFLLKDVPAEDLIEAIRVVANGDALLAPSITRRLLDRFALKLPSPKAEPPAAFSDLTDREREVLMLVAMPVPPADRLRPRASSLRRTPESESRRTTARCRAPTVRTSTQSRRNPAERQHPTTREGR